MHNHYLDARVSLMASRLLCADELTRLAAGSPAERAAVVTRAGLGTILAETEAGRYLEQSIVRTQQDDLLILLRAAGDGRHFLRYWAMRFELSNLKAIIRAKLSGAPINELRQSLLDLGFLASLPTEDLLRTEDVGELLRRLEATRYADMVRFARRAFEAQPQLFDLDAALDRRFYHGLVQQASPLASHGSAFHRLMEQLIDRVNLVWLLRYRFLYKLPAAQVYFLLVPSQYRLSSSVLRELSVLNRLEDVLAALPEQYRAWLRGTDRVYDVFTIMESKAVENMRAVLHSRAPAMARTFAYLTLRDHDLRLVRAALKGARMGLDSERIKQAMGLVEIPSSFEVQAA